MTIRRLVFHYCYSYNASVVPFLMYISISVLLLYRQVIFQNSENYVDGNSFLLLTEQDIVPAIGIVKKIQSCVRYLLSSYICCTITLQYFSFTSRLYCQLQQISQLYQIMAVIQTHPHNLAHYAVYLQQIPVFRLRALQCPKRKF